MLTKERQSLLLCDLKILINYKTMKSLILHRKELVLAIKVVLLSTSFEKVSNIIKNTSS